ncbi:conjugal transfer protein TraF [Gallibacterium anatis]|uniref:type IV secretion system protein VirB10 n=1 Tax=Gallibacterium anatis TaxID=750 RepID=UPI000531FC0A|nr:type IV secretion system protein VirB10 [Gallibacterium anatis]KGQ44618.1 conjugal transfer protein TraF [Gallibacterium anatis]KGQ48092.1 conjugal transfer protein TraF [Gallibacterium anatis]KGQ53651.1 conjugal transfer protein TraF [Gallibacterium anatis str. Avicor]
MTDVKNENNDDEISIVDVSEDKSRNNVETGYQRKKGNQKLNAVLAVVACVIIFAVLAYYLLPSKDQSLDAVTVKKDEALLNQNTSNDSLAAKMAEIRRQDAEAERLRREAEEAERLRKAQEAKEQEEAQQLAAEINSRLNNDTVATDNSEQVETPAQRRLRGTALIEVSDKSSRERDENGNENEMDNSLRGSVYSRGAAKLIRGRDLLLTHGTQIPCVLQTRLVTDHPSILICQVTKNIYSADGSTLLIERGSKVFGEQKKAITVGQTMAFVNWSEIDTPYGVRVRIDSLGTDSLGASGVNIYVDEKWGKRFGGAIMLSFIQDALSSASQIASRKSNGNIVYDNSEQNANRMAEIALENSINIQPTGYANQGQLVNILVARDVDFSPIYRLKGY